MDTKTLVVGQDVYMVSGHFLCKGKVTKVTPEGVEVQTIDEEQSCSSELVEKYKDYGVKGSGDLQKILKELHEVSTTATDLLHFDNKGKGSDEEGTFEGGEWHIDDKPFAERDVWYKALQAKRKDWLEKEKARKLRGGS